ncbi:MAG: hypothetical protein AAB347_08215 [Bacteroidota bacterium]
MEYYQKDFELGWLWGSFHNEQVRLLPLIDKTESNESNRTYVRSFFSMIEGITYRTRQILIERHKEKKIDLTPEQIIVLSEIAIDLKDNGSIKKRQKFYDFRRMTLFTYKTYCDLYNKTDNYKRFLSDTRFKDFNESVNMRNRITHPKTVIDVYINGNDILTVMSAGEWFHSFTIEIFKGDLIFEE